MLCRITQEKIENPWEMDGEVEEVKLKYLDELSLYDIGADDLSVWVGKKEGAYQLFIEDSDGKELMKEHGISEYAMDSIEIFCRQFLNSYAKYKK